MWKMSLSRGAVRPALCSTRQPAASVKPAGFPRGRPLRWAGLVRPARGWAEFVSIGIEMI